MCQVLYKTSLKRARKRAAKMLMPTSGVILAAKDLADAELEEDEAVAEEEPEPPVALPEAVEEAVAVETVLAAAEVEAAEACSLVVALREPHFSASLQVCWP